MSDRILIPIANGKMLALTIESFQEALRRGAELMPQDKPKPDDDKPMWLTVPEVSRLCNVSETHLRDEIALGHIQTRRFGRGVRIHRDFVEHQTVDLMSNGNNEE